MDKYMPDIYQKSIHTIDYKKLYNRGIRCILFDINNTLVSKDSKTIDNKLKELFDSIKKIGIKPVIYANDFKKRVNYFMTELGCDGYSHVHSVFRNTMNSILEEFKESEIALVGSMLEKESIDSVDIMNKFIGCGAVLQNTDSNSVGYFKNLDSRLCERCFKIRNYGEYISAIKDENDFIVMLESINKTNDLVILVCDLFNFNPNMELISKYINLILISNDNKSLYEEKLLNYIETDLNIVDKIIISSENNYHFDELMELIRKYKKSNDVYVIGYTNAGKSTMINKILYNYVNSNDNITTSILPNTTIDNDLIKIDDELNDIDTPGVLDDGSIYYYKDIKELKRITPKKAIKPISYQIKKKQSIVVEDLFRIDLENNDIVMYISNKLKVDRTFKNIKSNMDKYDIHIKGGQDIVVSGLGFIKFMKDEDITFYVLKGVKIYTRKSLI